MSNQLAFVAIVDEKGYSLGIAEKGKPGYSPQLNPLSYPFDLLRGAKIAFDESTALFASYALAKQAADLLNEKLFEITKEDALLVTLSSMANGTR